jgi:YggT family protein
VPVVLAFLRIYMIVLMARALLSWFPPPAPGSFVAMIQRFLYDVTEPVLAPLRRIIPPAGMFDISFMVLFLLLVILQQVLASAA